MHTVRIYSELIKQPCACRTFTTCMQISFLHSVSLISLYTLQQNKTKCFTFITLLFSIATAYFKNRKIKSEKNYKKISKMIILLQKIKSIHLQLLVYQIDQRL